MHELAICQSLLREVERTALANGSTEVSAIVVAIGPLSGVEAPLLARAFTVARGGSVAARATLEIRPMPIVVWCKNCAIETRVAANALLCGRCGAWQVDLRSGDELLLMRVELTANAQSAAAAS
jgi:hydrogenase nickel incorporation protein HypA/HybF